MAKSDVFVNTANETTSFYLDLDAAGDRLHGARRYVVRFDAGALPPVRGFWSLTVYDQHHFFHPNDLDRYSLGTKNLGLTPASDGSLTITVGGPAPEDPEELAHWLPAPDDAFTLYLRTYWPDESVLDGTWAPPPVRPA